MDSTSEHEDTGPPARVIPLRKFREHAGTIVHSVEATGRPVLISRYGKPLAELRPITQDPDTPTDAFDPPDVPDVPIRMRRPDPDDDPTPHAAAA